MNNTALCHVELAKLRGLHLYLHLEVSFRDPLTATVGNMGLMFVV